MPSFTDLPPVAPFQPQRAQFPNTGRLIGSGIQSFAKSLADGLALGAERRKIAMEDLKLRQREAEVAEKRTRAYLKTRYSPEDHSSEEYQAGMRLADALREVAGGNPDISMASASKLMREYAGVRARIDERERVQKLQRDEEDQAFQRQVEERQEREHAWKVRGFQQEQQEALAEDELNRNLGLIADSPLSVLNRSLPDNAELLDAWDGNTELAARAQVRAVEKSQGFELPRPEFDKAVEEQKSSLANTKARQYRPGIIFKTAEMNNPLTEGSPAWTLQNRSRQLTLVNEWLAMADAIEENVGNNPLRKVWERELIAIAEQMELLTIPTGTGITGEAESRLSNLDVRLYKETAGNPTKLFAWVSSQRAKAENLKRKLTQRAMDELRNAVDYPVNPSVDDFFPDRNRKAYVSLSGERGDKKVRFLDADGNPYGDHRLQAREVTPADELRKRALRGEFGVDALTPEMRELLELSKSLDLTPDQRKEYVDSVRMELEGEQPITGEAVQPQLEAQPPAVQLPSQFRTPEGIRQITEQIAGEAVQPPPVAQPPASPEPAEANYSHLLHRINQGEFYEPGASELTPMQKQFYDAAKTAMEEGNIEEALMLLEGVAGALEHEGVK